MVLTRRDFDLFLKLQSYGLLTTSQISRLVFANINVATVLRRLRKLEKDSYIAKVLRLEGHEIAWSVTVKGAQTVGSSLVKRNFRSDTLGHELKLTDLRLRLEGLGVAQFWTPEHEIRSKVARKHGLRQIKDRVIPDGLMGVNFRGSKESVAIELELNFKNSGRYRKIFRQYREKDSLWAVWYLVQTEGLGKAIEREWFSTPAYGNKVMLLWSLADEVLKDPLNAKVFGRAKIHLVKDLWLQDLPALPPALEVSSPKDTDGLPRLSATVEKSEEKLVPAS